MFIVPVCSHRKKLVKWAKFCYSDRLKQRDYNQRSAFFAGLAITRGPTTSHSMICAVASPFQVLVLVLVGVSTLRHPLNS